MNIKTGKICNVGGRPKNDDTAEIVVGNGAVRAYIGDGLGSYAGGKQASETAGQALLTYRGSMLSDEALRSAANLANQSVYALQNSTKGNMKTTIVFLNIEQDQARWMHVGDSRLYHFKNGTLVSQTTDHSVSQMAVMMGEITTHQIRFHEDRNRVLRSLGGENAKPELSGVVDVSEGSHAFLLCTDGFWEYVYEEEMEQTLRQSANPDEWIARMEKILLSRVNGSNDNYSASVVFVNPGAVAGHASLKVRDMGAPKKAGGKGLIVSLALVAVAAVAVAAVLLPKLFKPDETPETVVVTSAETVQEETTEAATIPAETTAPVTEAVTEPSTEAALDSLEDAEESSGNLPDTETSAEEDPVVSEDDLIVPENDPVISEDEPVVSEDDLLTPEKDIVVVEDDSGADVPGTVIQEPSAF